MIHILPTVPPAMSGVGDYCYKMWRHWPVPEPRWSLLAAQVPADGQALWPQAQVRGFDLSAQGLLKALAEQEGEAVLLHYVGYAYNAKGIPVWLPEALRVWKRQSRSRRLCVMFHEVPASGGWRDSSFWVRPVAWNIVRGLLRLSDAWVTSCPLYLRQLQDTAPSAASRGRVIPVGTTVEPRSPTDFDRPWPVGAEPERGARRGLRVVAFGLPGSRLWALREHYALLARLRERGLIESVLLIGQEDAGGQAQRASEEMLAQAGLRDAWKGAWNLSEHDISCRLAEQDLGLLGNAPDVLTKSTAYAAFCAHGVVPVAARAPRPQPAPLEDVPTPHVLHDARDTDACAGLIADATAVRDLKAQLQACTRGSLSWEAIARAWAQAAEPAGGDDREGPSPR